MRISDWSSDVCSSDLIGLGAAAYLAPGEDMQQQAAPPPIMSAATPGMITPRPCAARACAGLVQDHAIRGRLNIASPSDIAIHRHYGGKIRLRATGLRLPPAAYRQIQIGRAHV